MANARLFDVQGTLAKELRSYLLTTLESRGVSPTPREFAAHVGVSAMTARRFLRWNSATPSLNMCLAVAFRYGISVEDFFKFST